MNIRKLMCISLLALCACKGREASVKLLSDKPVFSGVYPHLAYYNNEGECGTGAVVPWADKLWVITYGPHLPFGSSDKLYEISADLKQKVRSESVGGTPANRLIHRESNQLFIGPYVINKEGDVRVISYKDAPGRYTGIARHLTDPEKRVYIGTMEEGFYDIDVDSLSVTQLYKDGNVQPSHHDTGVNPPNNLLPGAHGKGLYSGQGALYYSNNGEATKEALEKFDVESGSLSEWNGKEWKVIRRNQFTEITGPGGIYGNTNPETDPIWAIGWDHKSVILALKSDKKWRFFRLPKASYSYDGAHGWNTEWPRIRNVGTDETPDYLMTMHGMFWKFPGSFNDGHTKGIRPRSAYLKVIGDFTRWNDQLVFGCDESAKNEFLNKRNVKGNIGGPGQSNSNLWFTDFDKPDQLGPATASGYVWQNEQVASNETSEPFLFAGWDNRSAWIKNSGEHAVDFTFEVDKEGKDRWTVLKTVTVLSNSAIPVPFNEDETGEWIRVKPDKNTEASLAFTYKTNYHPRVKEELFNGLATINDKDNQGGLLYGLGDNRRSLGVLANDGTKETGYYELNASMELIAKDDTATSGYIRSTLQIPKEVIQIDESSVLIIDDKGRRWRLPLGDTKYKQPTMEGDLRLCREVVTERDLFNLMGTFYELPAENADGFAKIRPISSHDLLINDYASFRGLLVMTGTHGSHPNNEHIITSADGKASVWVGTIDDLWSLGKPVGEGGPWYRKQVKANEYSDAYLIGHYDNQKMSLSHNAKVSVTFTVQIDPTGDGTWMDYKMITVPAGEKINYVFPENFHARWIRFAVDKDTEATTWLVYK